ncbi:MAG: hypothetical protein CMM12_06490 [Rhodospirillaceae bacterium]|nr:hypothetical protein [Rhodospirillaceae bacterium]
MKKKPVNAPEIRVDAIEFSEHVIRFRMPFRYGILTVREAPQSFVAVRILDSTGRSATGRAREIDRFV